MKNKVTLNIILFVLIVSAGLCAGLYAFSSPCSIENASGAAISSLSIIFGLSAAVSAMLTSHRTNPSSMSNDPHMAKKHAAKAQFDDNRTLLRQKMLYISTLLSVMFGIVYLVVIKDAPTSFYTRVIAAIFSMGTTVSLMSTLFLPSLLSSLVKRNAYFQHNGSSDRS